MKYFAKITAVYTTSNKAHEEIQEYALSVDNNLLNSDEHKDRFIADFKQRVDDINAKHPRCKEIPIDDYSPLCGDVTLTSYRTIAIWGNFMLTIYPVKHELLLK